MSIVIPIYNEEAILEQEVSALIKAVLETNPGLDYELLLVENGSFDQTRKVAEDLAKRYPAIRVLYLPTAGYGQALKHGLLKSRGDLITLFNIDFWDAHFIRRAMELMQTEPQIDMVVGSKTMPGSEDTRPWLRRIITQTFNSVLRLLFGFTGTDTHGMKLIKRMVITPVINECQTEREIFDTEFVLRAHVAGVVSKEIPVVCAEKRKTTYRISKRIPRTIKDLFILFFSLNFGSSRRKKWAYGLLATLVFGFAVGYGFPDSPAPWFDEGVNLGIVKTWVQDGVYSLRLSPGQFVQEPGLMISTNYPILAWLALGMLLGGTTLVVAKIIMALFLIIFLVLSHRLVKREFSSEAAWLSTGLVVTFLPFYGNGLSGGLGEVPGLTYFFLGLWFLHKKGTETSVKNILWSGLFFGLAASTKVFYLTLLPAIGAGELYYAVNAKKIPWARWGWLVVGALAPLVLWVYTIWPNATVVSPWQRMITYYANPYHIDSMIVTNVWRFFSESTPAHFLVLFVGVLTALLVRFRKQKLTVLDIVIFVFSLLNVWWYVKTPGWYRYLFPAQLMLLVLFPGYILDLTKNWRWSRVFKYGILVLISIQLIHLVYHRRERLYYNPSAREFAQQIDALQNVDGVTVLIINHPELWFLVSDMRTNQFVQMNPYVAFGADVFVEKKYPTYLITSEPASEPYLVFYETELHKQYERVSQYGTYVVFKKRSL